MLGNQLDLEESVEQLAEKARAGCLVSFEKIMEQTKDRLFTFLVQIVGNTHDAEDLTQETFLKAYRNLASFDGRARFSTWLYTIAKNSAFSFLRRKRPHQSLDGFEDVLAAPVASIDPDDRDCIWTVARKLKPKFYETLWLFYAEGFSLKEVAEILQTNSVTVRVNLFRARAALARKYKCYESK
jgi:RNA polymerase sigma-70 factor, ECF subfamily